MQRSVVKTIQQTLIRPRVAIEAIAGAVIGYSIISFVINMPLIAALFSSLSFLKAFVVGLKIVMYNPYAVGGLVGLILVMVVSLLWGSSIALTLYYIRHSRTIRTIAGMGIREIIALIGGIISTGCWACGGVLLAPIVNLILGVVSLTTLYIGGVIVSGLSIALLVYSLYTVGKAIRSLDLRKE